MDLPERADYADFSPNVRDKTLYPGYDRNQKRAWKKVINRATQLQEKFDDNFPVKRGMKFVGYPLHFCTSSADRTPGAEGMDHGHSHGFGFDGPGEVSGCGELMYSRFAALHASKLPRAPWTEETP